MSVLQYDTRYRALGFAAVAVEKAARHGHTLLVNKEAQRLFDLYPDATMSVETLRDELAMLATRRGVAVEFS